MRAHSFKDNNMADLKFLKSFKKKLESMDDISTENSAPNVWFGTGNYVLNYILSGNFDNGVPAGRVTGLSGPSGSGKSFIQCNIAKEAQKKDAIIVMVDTENALDDDFVSKIGVSVNDNYYYVSAVTLDDVITIASNFVKGYKSDYTDDLSSGPNVLFVIDSLDMLLTETEKNNFSKGISKGDQGQRAKQTKAFLRNMVHQVKNTNIAMLITHQVYGATQEQVLKGQSDGNWVINGAVKYALSHIALLTKLKLKSGTEITGIKMKCQAIKTRFCKPFQDVVIEVPYEKGMNPFSGLIDVAESLGILSSKGPRKYFTEDGKDGKSFYSKDVEIHKDRIFELISKLEDVSVSVTDNLGLEEETVVESKLQQSKRRFGKT
jgi:recombination protein RecA